MTERPEPRPAVRADPTPQRGGPRAQLLWPACLCLVAALGAQTGAADPVVLACEAPHLAVSAEGDSAARRACDIAEAADRRLRALGLAIDEAVRIEITRDLDGAPGVCVALYSTSSRKVQVLPLDCLDDQPGRAKAFPRMSAEILFDSLILHELVHAYVDQSARGRFLPGLAHEYLAYAIQLDALAANERERVLARAGAVAPVRRDEINEALLSLSPLRFAAISWLHFRQEGGDAALVRRVLEGRLVFHSLRE